MKPFVPEELPLKSLRWERYIPLIGKANRALAMYEGLLHGLANPDILLSPITTQEAVLSSKIEGTQATLGEVFKFEAGEHFQEEGKMHDIQEIINYRRAMRFAVGQLEKLPLTLNLLRAIHAILLDSVRGRDKGLGQFRTIQNWIGPEGSPIEQANFVPPSPLILMEFLDNFEKYIHLEEPDSLVQLAIVHAQFEIIHPFIDGNGRVGRILIPLFLYQKDILSSPLFYLSAYLEKNREEYIQRLRFIDEKDGWDRWIYFFLTALIEQATVNIGKAKAVMEFYENLKERLIGLTHSQFAIPLLDAMFNQPIFRSSDLNLKKSSKQTIINLLKQLKEAGILKLLRESSGRRAQVFALHELINLCEGKEVI